MIIIPAEKLALAVQKHLLPGVIRKLAKEQEMANQNESTTREKIGG